MQRGLPFTSTFAGISRYQDHGGKKILAQRNCSEQVGRSVGLHSWWECGPRKAANNQGGLIPQL